MSILSGFLKTKKYRKLSDGYQLQSEWTSAETVEFKNGGTAETNLGAIQGITDSLAESSPNIALSANAGRELQNEITELNAELGGLSFRVYTQAQYNALAAKDANTLYVIVG